MRDVYNLIKQNEKERGFVLLAVLAFIAFILPVILLVLSTISAETMAVGEAVKGAKAERAADQAMESAVSVLLQEKQLPDYWVSKTQERNAIIVDNGRGFRRDGLVNGGAGLDGVYGTNDDYWIGPRKDRSYIAGDDTTDPRNYDYDFRYLNGDGPVYLAQRWAYNFFRNPYFYQPVNTDRLPVEFYNQFAAVEGDADGDGVNEGFNPDSLDQLLFPGYYPAAFPPVGPYESDITTGATIANAMLDYRTKLYEGIYENLDQGPVPSTLTRAYGSVTDESGRINLNIFCKKVRVWTEESSLYDTRFWDNSVTDDFNNNNMPGEWGWHWIDNPLFPDRNTVLLRDQTGAVTGNIDWAGVGADGWPNNSPDGESWIALGETVQHYYAADWVYSAIESKRMLMTLPGVNETLAENILRALNPDLSTLPNGGDEAAWTIPDADNHRVDAPNLTPALAALDVLIGGGGQITDFMFHYDWYNDDDLPLPTPRPFSDVKELLNVQGMTSTKFERLRDYVTVYSYDTNVVQNYIADVSSTVDPINPPDLPPGATSRPIPGYLVDNDTVPDLRYDINKPLADTSLSSLEQEADILMAFLRNHLPEGTYDKFALPVIDREHRGPSDHLGPAPMGLGNDGYPYNVGESGHEYNINLGGGATEPGAEYPALDPPFSRDSALSILLYRHGLTQADAFRYQDDAGNPRVVHEGIPIPGTRSFIPIIDPIILIPGLLEFYFQPAHVPSPELGQNVDAVIPPHYFDSVADILEVPLYKFSRFSVGIMADPPSDYLCAPIGKNAVMVNYYVSMSDIVKLGEYDTNGTTGDLTDDTVAYTYDVYFDYNYDGTWEDVVNLSFGDDLRLVSAPPTEARPGVITTFNQSTGQRYIRFDHLFDLAEVPDPDPALAGTVAGDFAFDYFGNPFITARVMAVKAAGTPEETLADSVVKVYLQENCDTFIPLKVSILAVRISADQFMLLSRAGGGVEDPGTFRLYDWNFNGSPQGIDGTWPMQAGGRDPRTVFVTPSSDTIRLTVYDLYSPAAIGAWPGLPVIPPSTALPPGIIVANQVQPPFPAMPYPPEGVDTDVVQVDLIGTMPNVVAEVACDPPSMEEDSSTLLHLGMYGGVSPYSVAVQVFDSLGGLVQSYNYGNYESNTLTIETDAFPIQDTYNVVFTVTDSTTPIPTSAIDATTLIVGGRGSPARSFTNVPNMTASINLHEVDQPNHGFRASVSVSGGRGEYGYLWQVFDEFGALAHGDQGQVLDSNDASPTFLFNPDQSQDGVYFVKVMVIDQKNVNPHNATNTVLATDTEMVIVGGPVSYDREPIATLAAIPPGNGEDAIGDNNLTAVMSGTGPQPYLSSDAGVPPVVPEIAGHGSIIEIYGYNFNGIPQNNRVTFGGGATALGFAVQFDPSYAGPPPFRQILRVVVPDNARTGWLTVTTDDGAGNGGTSGHAFFQTHFVVSFDLIGSIIPDTEHNYTMELDFQGDGIIDARADTSRMADSPGQVRQSQLTSLHHDYADDGFGNYTATLIVTDQVTGKSAVSHQLVQIRNLRPLVEDPNNTPEAYGLTTSIMPMYSDRYPLPGMGINVRSYTGGVTSHTGLKYKWNVDGNGRYSLIPDTIPSPVNPGSSINVNVSSAVHADARFLSPDVPVNYYAELAFGFTTTDAAIFDITVDTTVPMLLTWDVDGDGIPDDMGPPSSSSSQLYAAHVSGRTSYNFVSVGSYGAGSLDMSGALLVTDNSNNVYSVPFSLTQPVPLPTVEVSNVLSTLSLPTLGNDNRHLIALTVINEDYDMVTGRARVVRASDTIVIPSASNPQADVHAYLATQDPYSLTNVPGSLTYTLTGIYGQGSDMRFMADLNTDGHFEIGVLGFPNPQTHSRVTATNGLNRMNPGAINSFPTILPGVWFQFINIGIDVEADKGIYEAAALVRDNPLNPGDIPAYAFDSQVVFVGGNRGGGSASPLPLAVDTFIDPMVGVTTQGFSLESFVSGGAWPYTYNWSILHVDTGTAIQFSDGSQHFVPNPLFVPSEDAFDELGALVTGTYQVRLVVSDANGMLVVGQPRLIVVEQAPLNAQIMAIPPSVAVDEQVNFVVYVDGGMPPYDITVTYNDPNNPGASDSVTTSGRYTFFQYRYDAVWMDRTSPANGRYDDPEDGVNVQITVTDANGDIVSPVTHPFNAEQKVLVGERLPLNVTAVVSPSSGVSNFQVQVNYAVGGGRKFGGSSFGNMVTSGAATGLSGLFGEDSDYFVVVSLVSTDGSLVDMEFRDSRTTIINPYGADGIMMNGDTGELYDPVYLYVPYPGNYYVVVFVTDGAGEFAITQQQVFASGYLTPQMYGSTVPKVRRDRDGRPLHAVRVWVDPLYSCDANSSTWEENDYRLREADIQVFGDLLTVDPNPSFISPGFLAAKDPADCPQFAINYLEDPQTDSPADFYDTYTLGRININTAPEEVLASLFSKIIKERAYFPSDGANWSRGDRDYENDEYLNPSEARALAHAVVEYRNAYYDAYKPSVNGGGFDYRHGSGADPYASGDVRVDHLPVVGPWDGVNPRAADYPDPSSRGDVWPDQTDNDAINAWDNFRGIYYNLDRSVENLQFYAPSDIAVVRKQLTFETDEEYAKYLNDTLDNGTSLDGEDPWAIDQRRGFDARQYFFYDTEAGETRADARNEIALIYSGGEIAFTFIPNPPFQSVFDLYKVVGALTNDYYLDLMDWDDDGSTDEPRSFNVIDTDGDGNRDDVEVDANNFSTVERTLSGPSLFRYAEVWDAENNEFKVIANYLDDIAPYVTTRSYTFRIVGMGGVSISGGGMTAPVNADHIDRDRAIERVIDIGKMHTPRRDTTEVSADASERRAYMVLYEDRHSESGG